MRKQISYFAAFLILNYVLPSFSDQELPQVAFSGVFLFGNSEASYPIYSRNKANLGQTINQAVQQIANQKILPFNLLLTTDIENQKSNISDVYSLAIIITRDDIQSEHFATEGASIYKTLVNVGMNAVIYETTEDNPGEQRNTVIFSAPMVGYSLDLTGNAPLTEEQIDSDFISTSKDLFTNYLVKKLLSARIDFIYGKVNAIKNGIAECSIGSQDGLQKGQNVSCLIGDRKIATIKIDSLQANVSFGKYPASRVSKDTLNLLKIRAPNIKAFTNETYQVVDFKISSEKAKTFFDEKIIGPQVSQWLSDFLSNKTGKAVLPCRVGGGWDVNTTEQSFMLLTRDGEQYKFELPPPRYAITLDITGLTSKLMKSNNVEEIWINKAWIKIDIPSTHFAKEFDIVNTNKVISGVQEIEKKAILFDLLHELTAKIAREGNL